MSVNAIIYQDESGAYCADVPAMPGCHSDGTTYAEALANIQEAAQLWIEAQEQMALERSGGRLERIAL